jgi:hypothetical protein
LALKNGAEKPLAAEQADYSASLNAELFGTILAMQPLAPFLPNHLGLDAGAGSRESSTPRPRMSVPISQS